MSLTGNTYTGCNAVVVSLSQPSGATVGSAGACTGGTGFMDSVTLPVTGTYTLLVNPQGTTTGSVAVLINTFGDLSGTMTVGTPKGKRTRLHRAWIVAGVAFVATVGAAGFRATPGVLITF